MTKRLYYLAQWHLPKLEKLFNDQVDGEFFTLCQYNEFTDICIYSEKYGDVKIRTVFTSDLDRGLEI